MNKQFNKIQIYKNKNRMKNYIYLKYKKIIKKFHKI